MEKQNSLIVLALSSLDFGHELFCEEPLELGHFLCQRGDLGLECVVFLAVNVTVSLHRGLTAVGGWGNVFWGPPGSFLCLTMVHPLSIVQMSLTQRVPRLLTPLSAPWGLETQFVGQVFKSVCLVHFTD